ncbi:AMP-binding protein [Paraglaciecola sp.]|uniref:AMP-binding protein n=1 Tax=Paraglaciecola sp. TaxID=1920173 RepID=UPI0030F43CD9
MAVTSYLIDPQKINFDDGQHSSDEWLSIVAGYQVQLAASPAQSWLLFETDTFLFSALFYALLAAGKSIVLPQNAQPEHICEVKKRVQASIGCTAINPDVVTQSCWPSVPSIDLSIAADAEITFFTSGSTGQAKTIVKQFSQLQREVDVLELTFGRQIKGSVLLSTVSHQHIYGLLFKLLWPFAKGHAMVCQAFEYPEHIVHKIAERELASVSLIASPAHLHRLCQNNTLEPIKHRLNLIFSSGGPLDADKNMLLQQQLDCAILEVYGSTETGGIAWRQRSSSIDDIWQTFAGISVASQPVSDLLLLSSPYISQSPYQADDRIALLSPQQFRLLGRADDVVKIEEKRVSLLDVQTRLKQHEYIHDVCILVTGTQRKQLGAVIELNTAGLRAKDNMPLYLFNRQFRHFLGQWFEAVTLPKKFRYPLQLPYNAQGKLNRQAMESDFE